MEYRELGRVKETAGVQAIELKEVAPVGTAIGDIHGTGRGAEGAIGAGNAPSWLGHALAGASGDIDNEAGLVAIFGGRGAGDDLQGLHRVRRKLVGEHLALLVGDGLAIDGE